MPERIQGRGNVISDVQHERSWQRVQELEAPKEKAPDAPDVVHAAPKIEAHMNNVECNEGDSAHFECQYQPAQDPNVKIEWYLNGNPLAAGVERMIFRCLFCLFIIRCFVAFGTVCWADANRKNCQ